MNLKFKNPYFWLSIIAVVFAASGIDFNTLTSWTLLFEAIKSIFNNPVCVISVITAILGIWNNNDSPGIDTIQTLFNNKNGVN